MSKQGASNHESRRALALARRYLRFGTRSTAQLLVYLQEHRIPARLIETLITDCTRDGLLDDRACAKLWATSLADRGYAWAAIREQLLAKGLAEGLVTQVIALLQARASDEVRARAVVQERVRGRAGNDQRLRARVARFLSQRGFDSGLIDRVLTEALGPTSDS